MSYHNRMISTPEFLSHSYSPYWSYIACAIAQEKKENCEHYKNFLNYQVICSQSDRSKLQVDAICTVCLSRFDKTSKNIKKIQLGLYGF